MLHENTMRQITLVVAGASLVISLLSFGVTFWSASSAAVSADSARQNSQVAQKALSAQDKIVSAQEKALSAQEKALGIQENALKVQENSLNFQIDQSKRNVTEIQISDVVPAERAFFFGCNSAKDGIPHLQHVTSSEITFSNTGSRAVSLLKVDVRISPSDPPWFGFIIRNVDHDIPLALPVHLPSGESRRWYFEAKFNRGFARPSERVEFLANLWQSDIGIEWNFLFGNGQQINVQTLKYRKPSDLGFVNADRICDP